MADYIDVPWAVPKTPQIDAECNLNNDTALTGSISLEITKNIADYLGLSSSGEGTKIATIPFYLESDFGFSLGNKWESLVPNTAGEFLSTIYNLLTMGDIVEGAQLQVMSRAMQTLSWKGSENPKFTVNATFVCTQRNYNPVNIIKLLSTSCLPLSRDDASSDATKSIDAATNKIQSVNLAAVNKARNNKNIPPAILDRYLAVSSKTIGMMTKAGLIAPLEYTVNITPSTDSSTIERGRVALCIGNWFQATGLLVESISNISFSKEVIAPPPSWSNIQNKDSGFPLYAKCTITLTPYIPITFSDFIDYFTIIKLDSEPTVVSGGIRGDDSTFA